MKKNNRNKYPLQLNHGKKDVLIFKNLNQMADYGVTIWKDIAWKAIEEQGRFVVALSGGKTPVELYNRLALEKDFPWDKTYVFMVDERFVPYESDDNNYQMINRILLRHVQIPAKNIHPILTLESSSSGSALRYEEDLVSFFKNIDDKYPQFDLILLGIGDDGHTASIFPGSDELSLKETRHLTAAITPSDESKKERITLTFPVLNNAKNIVFLAAGENKAEIVKEIMGSKKSLLPAAMVKPKKGKMLFLLDKSAGSLL